LKQYQELKAKIVEPEDIQLIQGKKFLKKSYWRRIAKFFGVSLSLDKEWKEPNEDGTTTFYATITALAPNGQSCVGDGACNTGEKGLEKTDHNSRAIAMTRAKNRAISDLVGGGEVSAEEVIAQNGRPQESQPPTETNQLITTAQAKRVFAIAKDKKKKRPYTNEEIKAYLKTDYGIEHTKDIKVEWYDQICEDFAGDVVAHEVRHE